MIASVKSSPKTSSIFATYTNKRSFLWKVAHVWKLFARYVLTLLLNESVQEMRHSFIFLGMPNASLELTLWKSQFIPLKPSFRTVHCGADLHFTLINSFFDTPNFEYFWPWIDRYIQNTSYGTFILWLEHLIMEWEDFQNHLLVHKCGIFEKV